MALEHSRDPDHLKPQSNGRTPLWLRRWYAKLLDRRDAKRSAMPRLAAYYWEGGVPTAHEVLDFSESGAYIRTTASWYPGTIIELALQQQGNGGDAQGGAKLAVHGPCRVVRCSPGGVGVRFLFAEPAARKELRKLLATVKAGRKKG